MGNVLATSLLARSNIKGVQISIDGKGRATDNIMIECLWRSVEYEEEYLQEYESLSALIQLLKKHFYFYNERRSHQSMYGKTPAELYWREPAVKQAA